MYYTIRITGPGARITQGSLPIETVEQIKLELDLEFDLASYLLEDLDSDDKLNWFEVDDNFHLFGAYFNFSALTVKDYNGTVVYQEYCDKIQHQITEVEDLYPEDFKLELIGVLTCIEKFNGYFDCRIELPAEERFDPSKLNLQVKSVRNKLIISCISYDDIESSFDQQECKLTSEDFLAFLED